MSVIEQLVADIDFFRFQIDIINEFFTDSNYELCARKVYYGVNPDGSTNYQDIKGEIPGTTRILKMPRPDEIESRFPGITQSMEFVQQVYIQLGVEQLELERQLESERQANSLLNSNNSDTTSDTISGDGQ